MEPESQCVQTVLRGESGGHSLGTANQRQLWHVLVGDLEGD